MSLVAQNLGKRFGSFLAVDALSFTVESHEIYGLIGPNGAGKTTTLRMLATLMRPSSGRASIVGFDVEQEASRARAALGFLTGSMGLYTRLTIRELLIYFGQLYGLERQPLHQRIAELAELLHIAPLMERRCGALSTGERQRVSFARAMVHDPVVLILDEPTAGLDIVGSRFVRDFLTTARQRGRAILFSTHYLTEAELLCDRIGLLHRGQLLWQGPAPVLKSELKVDTLEEAFLRLVALAEHGDGTGVPASSPLALRSKDRT